MNYYNFIKQIKNISLSNGLVNETGEGDIYIHLNSGMHKYPCVFLTVQNVTFTNDIVNVNATLFYVDRLLDNSSNKLEIQSNGITVLSQILDRIAEETVINTVQNVYTPFEEKFADLCAGQFVTFRASFPNDVICSDDEFEVKTITLNHNGIYDIIGYDKAVVAVEGGVWGQIKGNIEDQTDLIELVDDTIGSACECVNAAKEEILNAIDEIDIDTTELAKQGTDSNANITDITEKLQQIIGANILQPNLQGITFAEGYATDNVLDILMYDKRYIDTITSETTKPIISYAFASCVSLTEINFPNTTSIGSYAFDGCSSLHTLNIPNTTSIGGYAFYNCTSLRTAEFPNVTAIGTSAFSGCGSLRTAEFPNVTAISNTTFYNCLSLQTVEFPNATSIGDSAFQQCTSLQTVEFPNATSIGVRSFYGCTRLSKAIFPNATVVQTGGLAGNTALKYLDISSVMSFTTSNSGPLQNCPNLIDIHMGKNITTNVSLLQVNWNPTNAYLNTTNSLVPDEVRAEHPEWTNRDYLLYCLREHFAANLPDRTGLSSLTITFNSTMKTHINNSPETAAAFTNKNYIIA